MDLELGTDEEENWALFVESHSPIQNSKTRYAVRDQDSAYSLQHWKLRSPAEFHLRKEDWPKAEICWRVARLSLVPVLDWLEAEDFASEVEPYNGCITFISVEIFFRKVGRILTFRWVYL